MTVTKKALVLPLAAETDVKEQVAYKAVESVIGTMRESLIRGDRIEIRGFGVLGVKHSKARLSGRKSRTGEVVHVPARMISISCVDSRMT